MYYYFEKVSGRFVTNDKVYPVYGHNWELRSGASTGGHRRSDGEISRKMRVNSFLTTEVNLPLYDVGSDPENINRVLDTSQTKKGRCVGKGEGNLRRKIKRNPSRREGVGIGYTPGLSRLGWETS